MATTDNYTYVHTLSLPDALPILPSISSSVANGRHNPPNGPDSTLNVGVSTSGAAEKFKARARLFESPRAPSGSKPKRQAIMLRNEFGSNRSEEHTSELQSLMRIPYAVFCLNKKTKNTHTN